MTSGLLNKAINVAKGTSSKKPKTASMILVHANKHELDELDKAQGGTSMLPGTDIRSYKRLGKTFKNPDMQSITLKAARLGKASGGVIQKLKSNGRKGDRELALFPVHMADHFDRMMGKRSINPIDGKREYFDFSGFASGLGQVLGGMQQNPSGAKTPSSSPSTSSPQGGGWGNMLGQLAGSFANNFMQPKPQNQTAPQYKPQQPQTWQDAGTNGALTGLIDALQTRQNGGSWQDSLRKGAMSGVGAFAQQAPISSMYGGQGFGSNGALSSMISNPYAKAAMSGLGTAARSYMQGNNIQNSLTHGLDSGLSGFNNPYAQAARSGLQTYQNTGDWRRGAMSSLDSGLSNFNNPYAQSSRAALQDYQRTGNLEGSAMTGASHLANQYGYGNAANTIQGVQNARQAGAGWGEAAQRGTLEGLQGMNNPYANAARAGIQSNLNGNTLENSLINGGIAGLSSMLPPQQNSMAQPSNEGTPNQSPIRPSYKRLPTYGPKPRTRPRKKSIV